MTGDTEDVSTADEFQQRLTGLVANAAENGVDVDGGWTCETEHADEAWSIVVTMFDAANGSDSDAFQRQLNTLISEAVKNDVTVEGGWECVSNPSRDEWDVVISRIERAEASE